MSAIDRLFTDPLPLDRDQKKDALFLEAMRESLSHHEKNSVEFASLCEEEKFEPASLLDGSDLQRIPYFFVNVFKEYQLLSVPKEEIVLALTSSGTTGSKKSQNYWDSPSLKRLDDSVLSIGNQLGLLQSEPTNYLLFGYDPREAKEVGTAWSDDNIQRLTGGAKEVCYVLKKDKEEEYRFDLEGTLEALIRFAASNLPLRLIGFPSFMHFLVQAMKETGTPPLALHPHSAVITGGGWKNHRGEEIPFLDFCQELNHQLGILPERIHDIYGLVEHGIPYFTCSKGRFHIPSFCRVLIRRPGTMEVLPTGERGLMQIISPYMRSVPTISLLTSDYAMVEDNCPCGLSSPTFRILGRGGVVKHKGCAIKAAEILGRT
ncbi:MAG TPA: hypothetical protein V6C82_09095 [Chroococcales cyanobacterium]|jgi:phenylacetate-coenzyme A ligase PaaK-like adenylate-forming protein